MTTRPASINFVLYPGATFSEHIVLKDGAGQPMDLTGFDALMHVRRELEDALPVITLSTADGSITLGGAAGTVDLLLTPDQTAALTSPGVVDWDGEVWVHDILLTNSPADPDSVDRIYQGRITVRPGVTRA